MPSPSVRPAPGTPSAHPALHGLQVFERGWLSSNNVLAHGSGEGECEGEGATLIDSSHCLHAEQTVALVRQALQGRGEPLGLIVNTHLHSDHCGGNAALQRAFGAPLHIPEASAAAVRDWDPQRLSFLATGQRIERFAAQGVLRPGQTLRTGAGSGARAWQVLAAPGHDPDSVMLFDARHGVLVSADALWENGFGVVFPELDGVDAFDDVAAVLDLIATLPVQVVIPGHGAPFTDVAGALARARGRLAAFRADPLRHARHAAKVLLKYHLMEERQQALPALQAWARDTPLAAQVWQRLGRPEGSAEAWALALVRELCEAGALHLHEAVVSDG
jgi:glyoxylase-like metal-dependent hydrolase (beta-lactamase superfamily II)